MANWTSPSQSSPKLEKEKKNKQMKANHKNIFNNPMISHKAYDYDSLCVSHGIYHTF